MKIKAFFLLVLFVTTSTVAQQNDRQVLTNIQKKIRWGTPADSLRYYIKNMEQLQNGKPNAMLQYWEAYSKYLLYFDYNLGNPDSKLMAEKTIEEGIALIEPISTKTAEHYALWSLLGGLQLNFTNMLMLPFKAAKVGKSAEKAIETAPDNLRGYVAQAIYDYHTPKMYGGGKLVENNLKKALTLNDKADSNPYSPDWGRAEAYYYLVKFYNRENQSENTQKYLKEGLEKYPNFGLLKKIRDKLK